MVPGNTLNTHRSQIDENIKNHNPVVISEIFVADEPTAYAFFVMQKDMVIY